MDDDVRDPHLYGTECVSLKKYNHLREELNESENRRADLFEDLMKAQRLNATYRKELDKREAGPFQQWFQGIHPELFKTITVEFK